jgi:hypothetical protein
MPDPLLEDLVTAGTPVRPLWPCAIFASIFVVQRWDTGNSGYNGTMKTAKKHCTFCGEEKPLSEFSPRPQGKLKIQSRCKVCCSRIVAAKYRGFSYEERRNFFLLREYGVSKERYDAMVLAQEGVCAICGKPPQGFSGRTRNKVLVVDHVHETGKVRGLLCGKCNTMLGHANEQVSVLERAIAYLKYHDQK